METVRGFESPHPKISGHAAGDPYSRGGWLSEEEQLVRHQNPPGLSCAARFPAIDSWAQLGVSQALTCSGGMNATCHLRQLLLLPSSLRRNYAWPIARDPTVTPDVQMRSRDVDKEQVYIYINI